MKEFFVLLAEYNSSWDLYLINADGSGQHQLTNDPGIEGLPTWSPDGQWIAYLSDAGGNWGIWMMRADGAERRQLFSYDGGTYTLPAIAEPYLLTSLAGHLAFSDLGALDGNAAADALAQKAADFILPQGSGGRPQGPGAGQIVRFPRAWTDDMFMATSVLARVGARTTDDKYAAAAGRLLTSYAADLQRPDGLFIA